MFYVVVGSREKGKNLEGFFFGNKRSTRILLNCTSLLLTYETSFNLYQSCMREASSLRNDG